MLNVTFQNYIDEFDTPDWWHFAKSITKGCSASIMATAVSLFYAMVNNNWDMSEHYTSHGCQSSPSIFHTQRSYNCPNEEIEKKLRNIADDYLMTSLKEKNFTLRISTIILLWTLWDMTHYLMKKHQRDWKRLKSQRQIEQKSNLTELSREAKILTEKYGSLYEIKKSKTPHPDFLCEPGTQQLMDLPPVVSSDGYARGFTQFVLITSRSQNSAPYGIIDQPLLGHLLAYIQNQPLPTETVLQPNKFNLLKTIKMIIILLQNLAKELKDVGMKIIYRYMMYLTGICGYIYFKKSSSNEPISIKDFDFLKFATWSILLLTFLAKSDDLYNALMRFYESQIRLNSYEYASEELKNELKNSRLITVSSLCMCPLSQALLDKAVICQDGNTYEEKIIKQHFNFEKSAIIRSPISRIEFKDYPLLWPYHQRRKQIEQLKKGSILEKLILS